jgi:hypothetical protein
MAWLYHHDDVAEGRRGTFFIGRLSMNTVLTCVRFMENNKETRGPMHGRNVSPICLVHVDI